MATKRKNIVHVVGTGTIGEPLIGLFSQFRECWGIDEVTFHKRTPSASDRGKVQQLVAHGARLATDEDSRDDFAQLGHRVSYSAEEAIERATVVVDCTPAGNENKSKYYERSRGPRGFLAQGSEFGFGKPYARGINDDVMQPEDRFVQIVSCFACAARTTSPTPGISSPRPRPANTKTRGSVLIMPVTPITSSGLSANR